MRNVVVLLRVLFYGMRRVVPFPKRMVASHVLTLLGDGLTNVDR